MRLIEQFEKLPGIGRKSAQRLAFHTLALSEKDARAFAEAIIDAKEKLHRCPTCQNFTDRERCNICADAARDRSIICVVESPRDIMAFERTREYRGQYHVLHGLISPMDGVGPDSLTLKELVRRAAEDEVKEVVMATNPTVEGEATAMYIARLLKPFEKKVTRLAYGIPMGGNLEYADEITLFRALEGRNEIF